MRMLISGYGPRTAGGNTEDRVWDDGHLHYLTHRDLRELFSRIGLSQVSSRALINNPERNLLRRGFDLAAGAYALRKFLSGFIMLWAIK